MLRAVSITAHCRTQTLARPDAHLHQVSYAIPQKAQVRIGGITDPSNVVLPTVVLQLKS